MWLQLNCIRCAHHTYSKSKVCFVVFNSCNDEKWLWLTCHKQQYIIQKSAFNCDLETSTKNKKLLQF